MSATVANIRKRLYQFHHGHPFLLGEEVAIICDTRLDPKFKWMNDNQIQALVKVKVKAMYHKKYPNAKMWGLFPSA
mgnify:CR=1 FL=1